MISIVLLTSMIFTTIVYSAFSTQLQINGDAIVRSDNDVRITGIKILNQINGSYETYNNKYTKGVTSMYVTLPSNSSLTYEIEITNKSNVNYFVKSIEQQSHTNTNVIVDISLNIYDVINSNSISTFTITLTNNTSTEQQETLVYKYNFMEDSEAPTLTLTKETYIENDFSNWYLNGATLDNGILTLDEISDSATSDYIDVNGGFWYTVFDGYVENLCDRYSSTSRGGISWRSLYYDLNYNSTEALTNAPSNGWAVAVSLNNWNERLDWFKMWKVDSQDEPRYGSNVKYVKLYFDAQLYEYSSLPPIKIRNLKIYGEAIQNSFYLINITSNDNEKVISTKYAKGEQTSDYFNANGIDVNNNQIRVTENGIYTIYVSDIVGNSTIETIEITNIE